MFLLNMGYIFCFMALLINTPKLIAVGSSSKSQGDSIMQNVKSSERAHIAAENKARQISDIVNEIKEMSPVIKGVHTASSHVLIGSNRNV